MVGDIIDGSDDSIESNSVIIGNDKIKNDGVTFGLVHEIFKKITNKTSRMSESFNDSILLEMTDIENLHQRIYQLVNQHDCHEENCSISVFYLDDTSDIFDSFDNFVKLTGGSSSGILNIAIKYNFLFLVPKTKKIQTYTVLIDFLSVVALEEKIVSDFQGGACQNALLYGKKNIFYSS